MATGMFKPRAGIKVRWRNKFYTILPPVDNFNYVIAREEGSGELDKIPTTELLRADETAVPPIKRDLSYIKVKDWDYHKTRYDIIKPIIEKPKSLRTLEFIKEIAEKNDRHFTTIYRWVRQHEKVGLIPNRYRDEATKRLSSDVEAIIDEIIKTTYLKPRKPKAQTVINEIIKQCKEDSHTPPHPNTIRNRLKNLDRRLLTEAREGKKAAEHEFRIIRDHYPGADWPLAVAQIDHTTFPVELVDDDRFPIGKPWATLSIDVYSRMVHGVYIALETPNENSVGLCMYYGILPKTDLLTEAGIDQAFLDEMATKYPSLEGLNIDDLWPIWGFADRTQADNAKEFDGTMIERACGVRGKDFEFRSPGEPRHGGHIERLLGNFKNDIKELPGGVHGDRKHSNYNSEKHAVMTLGEFRRWFIGLVVKYNHSYHTGINNTPVKRYKEGVFGVGDTPGTGLPELIADEQARRQLRLDFMPFKKVTIQSYGIAWDVLHYRHDILRQHIHKRDPDNPRKKMRFVVRRDPHNVSVIYFWDPDLEEYFEISNGMPPMTIWEYRSARARLREQGKKKHDQYMIYAMLELMKRQVESSERATKSARRKKQQSKESEKTRTTAPKVSIPAKTGLERLKNMRIEPSDDVIER